MSQKDRLVAFVSRYYVEECAHEAGWQQCAWDDLSALPDASTGNGAICVMHDLMLCDVQLDGSSWWLA